MAPIERTLRDARRAGLLRGDGYAAQIDEALDEGVISEDDAEALRRMDGLRAAVIKVDSFEHYGRQHALKKKPAGKSG